MRKNEIVQYIDVSVYRLWSLKLSRASPRRWFCGAWTTAGTRTGVPSATLVLDVLTLVT